MKGGIGVWGFGVWGLMGLKVYAVLGALGPILRAQIWGWIIRFKAL